MILIGQYTRDPLSLKRWLAGDDYCSANHPSDEITISAISLSVDRQSEQTESDFVTCANIADGLDWAISCKGFPFFIWDTAEFHHGIPFFPDIVDLLSVTSRDITSGGSCQCLPKWVSDSIFIFLSTLIIYKSSPVVNDLMIFNFITVMAVTVPSYCHT